MTAAWRGACQLAAAAVRAELRKLDRQAKGGLLVDPEQRKALGLLADWLAAVQHQGPGVLVGVSVQGSLLEAQERADIERRPMGFRKDGES